MRIDIDDPAVDKDLGMSLTYEGELFTGEAVEKIEGTDTVIALTAYVRGREDGPSVQWHEDGALRSEGQCSNGRAVGVWREWFQNGAPAMEQEFSDRGALLRQREWSESGEIIKDFRRD